MKYLSFVRRGVPGFGALVEDGVIDLTGLLQPGLTSLREAIRLEALPEPGALPDKGADFKLSDVVVLPVIPDAGKILCAGVNYVAHRDETKRSATAYPTIFIRFADSQVGHRQPIVKPDVSDCLDYEGELAVVIGTGGRNISEDDAMSHVFGFTCFNDATVRDWQRHTQQFTPGKTFPGTGGCGPVLVTLDEIGDYRNLTLTTRLNGEVVQNASLTQLIFSIPELISYCSRFTPLSPGDVILTGTPGGVGDRREPPLYLKSRDLVEVEIPGVGTLVNPVMAEQ